MITPEVKTYEDGLKEGKIEGVQKMASMATQMIQDFMVTTQKIKESKYKGLKPKDLDPANFSNAILASLHDGLVQFLHIAEEIEGQKVENNG